MANRCTCYRVVITLPIIVTLLSTVTASYFFYLYYQGVTSLSLWKKAECTVYKTQIQSTVCSTICNSSFGGPVVCTNVVDNTDFSAMGKGQIISISACPNPCSQANENICYLFYLIMKVYAIDANDNVHIIPNYNYPLYVNFNPFVFSYNITDNNITCYNNVCNYNTTNTPFEQQCQSYNSTSNSYIKLQNDFPNEQLFFIITASAAGLSLLLIIITITVCLCFRKCKKVNGKIEDEKEKENENDAYDPFSNTTTVIPMDTRID